jgi:hypothetical protein
MAGGSPVDFAKNPTQGQRLKSQKKRRDIIFPDVMPHDKPRMTSDEMKALGVRAAQERWKNKTANTEEEAAKRMDRTTAKEAAMFLQSLTPRQRVPYIEAEKQGKARVSVLKMFLTPKELSEFKLTLKETTSDA